jgi:hypothetical protein
LSFGLIWFIFGVAIRGRTAGFSERSPGMTNGSSPPRSLLGQL